MTVTIAQTKTRRGDLVIHMAGCKDLTNSRHTDMSEGPANMHTGDTLLDAIIAADTDMADWFCQKVYDPNPPENPWSVSQVEWAPCFAAAVKKARIVFTPQPRPDEYTSPAPIPSVR